MNSWSKWQQHKYADAYGNEHTNYYRKYSPRTLIWCWVAHSLNEIKIRFTYDAELREAFVSFLKLYPIEYKLDELEIVKANINEFINRFDKLLLFS